MKRNGGNDDDGRKTDGFVFVVGGGVQNDPGPCLGLSLGYPDPNGGCKTE